ncbi:hypothetical protein DFQ01_1106 [Paenibacillus cellulosilyticus]|uniref:Glycoside hydrolase family 127 protein n=1 Tax=Paenibacillus cellulosilyticus TaxID=375489 RepID=A0A2V2YSE9_9BACL|nr:beta-L-arabinofuranosidase domain-containing protein [Paenibacillus cellulosilyticus]PWW01117.1 hypothetical protein DFQ01_1106 [Paenibacillus cellulosilyticus]QKS46914.1 glycoside hydrolase family 127 protein [Paenibacillus cellulosilyticus]
MATSQTKFIPLRNIRIEDRFWSEYVRLVREVVVPYQWRALNDEVPEAEPSHAVHNFKIAAGQLSGNFEGMVFQDSDVAKWLEAAAYLLETKPDPELESLADGMIDIIALAQQPDGYLNTYFTIKEPGQRWTNLAECHELYCAGHMIEAAVAYDRATGKRKLLDIVCRFADHIDSVFGPEPEKLKGYDGHQEIELALVKLYRATGEERYLKLSEFFLNQRGTRPHFYEQEWEKRGGTVHFKELRMSHDYPYSQAHLPVREQQTAEGHSVRAVYMLTGMADVAALTGDTRLLEACKTLWGNIVSRRMYITGAIGSQSYGESFTSDYDLPGDTVYAETCASIGLIFFAHRMLSIEPKSEYADVMERALYNTVVSGMSQDGKHFFYVNPLEVNPGAVHNNAIYHHIKTQRQGWFGCACCPPNIARLLASLGSYIYTFRDRTVYTQLYIGGHAEWELDGSSITLEQQSDYAWEGKVQFRITAAKPTAFTMALRVPDWTDSVSITLNGMPYAAFIGDNGYIEINRVWSTNDRIELEFGMPIHRMKGHPLVRHTAGRIALQRGPFVYCLEEADNGASLHQLYIPRDSELQAQSSKDLLGGVHVITTEAVRGDTSDAWQDGALYRKDAEWRPTPVTATFIPYYAWANRGEGEMTVWVKELL